MTPETINLVQESFRKVAPIADQAADIFYARLFEIAPGLRRMFPDDMTGQKRKLMSTLAFAVNSLRDLDTLLPALKDLGIRHIGYGVEDEQCDTVGAALLYALEKGLGDAWSQELHDAWAEVYGFHGVGHEASRHGSRRLNLRGGSHRIPGLPVRWIIRPAALVLSGVMDSGRMLYPCGFMQFPSRQMNPFG